MRETSAREAIGAKRLRARGDGREGRSARSAAGGKRARSTALSADGLFCLQKEARRAGRAILRTGGARFYRRAECSRGGPRPRFIGTARATDAPGGRPQAALPQPCRLGAPHFVTAFFVARLLREVDKLMILPPSRRPLALGVGGA